MRGSSRITVLGGGLWGTTLAQHLAGLGHDVVLWEFDPALVARLEGARRHPHLPGLRLHRAVRATADLAEAAAGGDVLLVALPSQHARATAARLKGLAGRLPYAHIVSASKGLEAPTLMTMCEVLEDELGAPAGGCHALTGPSFAREVARGLPTAVLLAGDGRLPPDRLAAALEGRNLRVRPWHDRKGAELGGCVKNVLAVACGIVDGMGLGANTKAWLFTEAAAEMAEVVRRAGGDVRTVYGLAGLGDFMATGTSVLSRNRTFGEHLGRGLARGRALRRVETVVEGAEAAEAVRRLCRRLRVAAPILTAVWRIVSGRAPAARLLDCLEAKASR